MTNRFNDPVTGGQGYWKRESRGELLVLGHIARLTPRQRQVFDLVVGRINKQIGYELGATERTIKAHRQRVMEKMQVQSVAELVTLAERVGVLSGMPDSRIPSAATAISKTQLASFSTSTSEMFQASS